MRGSSRNTEFKLLLELRKATALKYLGCRFDRGLVGAVTVSVADTPLGAWWYEAGDYCFSRIAYRPATIKVRTTTEVLAETQAMVTAQMTRIAISAHS